MADILIVDDDSLSRDWIEEFLLRHGYRVEAVASSFEAVARIEANSYSLVITDITMPDMDGIELVRHITRHAPWTAIIAVSGSLPSLRDPIARLLQSKGVKRLLNKPIDCDALLQAIAGVVLPVSASAQQS